MDDNNPCIRTGATIYFEDYGGLMVGDLYQIGDVYILNSTGCNMWTFSILEGEPVNMKVFSYKHAGSTVRVWHEYEATPFTYKGEPV